MNIKLELGSTQYISGSLVHFDTLCILFVTVVCTIHLLLCFLSRICRDTRLAPRPAVPSYIADNPPPEAAAAAATPLSLLSVDVSLPCRAGDEPSRSLKFHNHAY